MSSTPIHSLQQQQQQQGMPWRAYLVSVFILYPIGTTLLSIAYCLHHINRLFVMYIRPYEMESELPRYETELSEDQQRKVDCTNEDPTQDDYWMKVGYKNMLAKQWREREWREKNRDIVYRNKLKQDALGSFVWSFK